MNRLKNILLAAAVGIAVWALRSHYFSRMFARIPASVQEFFTGNKVMSQRWQFYAACIGWIIFSLYWEVAAKKSAQAQNAESKTSRRFHVVLTNAAILLVMAPIIGWGRFLPMSLGVMKMGLVIEALGLFVAIWARRCLGRNWSGEISIKVEHEIIRSGPYRWLRHPIYTGLLLMYVGSAFVTGGWLATAGVVIAIAAYWRKIRLEEQNLIDAFGAKYEAYRHETWSVVPGVY